MGKTKHGPRYGVKKRKKAWVERDRKGKFKNWVNKKRSLAGDRHRHAKKGKRAGEGGYRDYS